MSVWIDELPSAVDAARLRISPFIFETPVNRALWIDGPEVWLKCEHLQHTGSFKVRGALNRLLDLDEDQRRRGVIAASTGNHGQGIARAAQVANIDATVYVPAEASPVKMAAMRAMGVAIETVAGNALAAELAARAAAVAAGRIFVSPYNDPAVVAGQGTIGAELDDQIQDLDAVFVAVGGGGLISGIAAALKARKPRLRVVGCWPQNAPAMQRCLEAGQIIEVAERPTLSDGTAGGVEPGAITFEACRSLIDEQVLVSEAEISSAMKNLVEHERWVVEGAAGVALAGCLRLAPDFAGARVAVVLCGRNIAFEKFQAAIGFTSV
ncbi:MAG: threonine/serine dehydratase [Pseudomonadales bacterium]